jgi:hypothetical protein
MNYGDECLDVTDPREPVLPEEDFEEAYRYGLKAQLESIKGMGDEFKSILGEDDECNRSAKRAF